MANLTAASFALGTPLPGHYCAQKASSRTSAATLVSPIQFAAKMAAKHQQNRKVACNSGSSDGAGGMADRRDVLAAFAAAVPALQLIAGPIVPPAQAAYGSSSGGGEEAASGGGGAAFTTFYGAAAPPATYGSLGGTTKDKAKYSYEVPSNWVEEATTKVEKGAGGQDSRWVQAGSRGRVKAFCLTLNRAGQDGAAYELTDSAINAVAAADSSLQSVIATGNVTSKPSSKGGQDYITYDIESSQHYTIKLTIDNTGRLFAFVVTAPDRTFQQERKTLDRMAESFTTYVSASQFV